MAPTVPGFPNVHRAIAVSRGVVRHGRTGVTATVLSEELELNRATVRRLLQPLLNEGILTIDPCSKRYFPGPELRSCGDAAHHDEIREGVLVHLNNLRRRSGETVLLFVKEEMDSLCLARIDGEIPIPKLTLSEGSRRPLGVGAGGLALLAAQPPRFVDEVLANNAGLYRDYFDAPLDEIRHWITDAVARGFTFKDGRLRASNRAVGIAVAPQGAPPLAAVSIATDAARMSPARRAELERLLKAEFENFDLLPQRHDERFHGETL